MPSEARGYSVIGVIGVRADDIDKLAYRIERLTPHPRWPERFHEEKSEIIAELRQLARRAQRG